MHRRNTHWAWSAAVILAALPAVNAAVVSSRPAVAGQPVDSSAPAITIAALARRQPVLARRAMVVSAQHLATEVGVRILREGGNAIDAAVAVGYALAVVQPCCGNVGGG
ncbi:gamma-glutamyltranspeptidase protein, partial [mine drainage metagenome]